MSCVMGALTGLHHATVKGTPRSTEEGVDQANCEDLQVGFDSPLAALDLPMLCPLTACCYRVG